jgi:hypothetical protein
MPEIKFYISGNDLDRLFAIKSLQGKDKLTGNDFAEELLTRELHRLFPAIPDFDDNGRLLNAGSYRGK